MKWTKVEEDFILSHRYLTNQELAIFFNYPVSAIQYKKRRMNIDIDRTIKFSKYQIEILNGLLLSDASILYSKTTCNPFFSIDSVTQSFIDKIKYELPFRWRKIYIRHYNNLNKHQSYKLASRTTPSLINYHDEWYPNKIKIIPYNLILTPLVVKYWFYGDGSTSWRKQSPHSVALSLHTNGFSVQDVKLLVNKLKEDCGLDGFLIQKSTFGAPVISTSKIDLVQQFFKYIGDCDVKGFDYKWKIPYHIPRNYNRRKIKINNITYISQTAASKALHMCTKTISKRISQGLYSYVN